MNTLVQQYLRFIEKGDHGDGVGQMGFEVWLQHAGQGACMVASSWLHKRDSTRAEPHAR